MAMSLHTHTDTGARTTHNEVACVASKQQARVNLKDLPWLGVLSRLDKPYNPKP